MLPPATMWYMHLLAGLDVVSCIVGAALLVLSILASSHKTLITYQPFPVALRTGHVDVVETVEVWEERPLHSITSGTLQILIIETKDSR